MSGRRRAYPRRESESGCPRRASNKKATALQGGERATRRNNGIAVAVSSLFSFIPAFPSLGEYPPGLLERLLRLLLLRPPNQHIIRIPG